MTTALPIDGDLARTLADNAIGLFLEYRDQHGNDEPAARVAAIAEVVDGATTELERRCRICGCTDAEACDGGCTWYAVDVCDRCVNGAALIETERLRQELFEGHDAAHDAQHVSEELALAACCYAVPPSTRKYRPVSVPIEGGVGVEYVPTLWPWEVPAWKPVPADRVRELVKAGALIAAEIDRLRAATAASADDAGVTS
jgi:hypothetical protein